MPILPADSGSGVAGGGNPLQVSTILTVLGALLGLLTLLVLVQRASVRGVKLLKPSTWRSAFSRGGATAGAGTFLQRQSSKDGLAAPLPVRVAPLLVMMPDDQVQCAITVEVDGAEPAPAAASVDASHPAAPAQQAGQGAAGATEAVGQADTFQVVELSEIAEEKEPPMLLGHQASPQPAAIVADFTGNSSTHHGSGSSGGSGGSMSAATAQPARQEQQQQTEEPPPAGLPAAVPPAGEQPAA